MATWVGSLDLKEHHNHCILCDERLDFEESENRKAQIQYHKWTTLGIRGGGMKESSEESEVKYDIFDTL
jgi:hypothetical protein